MARHSTLFTYVTAIGVVLILTLIAYFGLHSFDRSNIVMLYLLVVTGIAYRYGRGAAVIASILSVAAFDFFFIPPHLTFAVSDLQYLLTFLVMLSVALLISALTVQVREQAEQAEQREQRTAVLYAMTRELASTRGINNLLNVAAHHISSVFNCQTVVLLPNSDQLLQPAVGQEHAFIQDQAEMQTVRWAFEHSQIAGHTTEQAANSVATYLPLIATRGTLGVLAVALTDPTRLENPDQVHLLETFVNQTTVAIERAYLAEEAQAISIQVETERLRNSLLSSVSHDLRTPLASITGAASSLLEHQPDPTIQQELVETIADEADWLNRLLSNLLEMTRIEAGAITVHKEWHVLEEIIGSALQRLARHIQQHHIQVEVDPYLPLVPLDNLLIEQVLINLIENALKYTPANSTILIKATAVDQTVTVSVADSGKGLSNEVLQHMFDKFYRGKQSGKRGVGLGLAICRGIILAHGGRIWAQNRSAGAGAIFAFTLPIEGTPPRIELE